MNIKIQKIIPFIFGLIIVGLFFYKSFLKGYIPFPGDMLVGAYYPWLDYKWSGFQTSVPIKNPLITDVFSQFFIWKKIIIDSFKNLQFPLWNIYSYSGYPLFANFHSGVLNPFNLLMLFFKYQLGWTFLIASQFFFSFITIYFFLKQLYPNKTIACLIGSIVYSFSGFMITWSQFATAGFAMVWLPLIFLSLEKFFITNKYKYLLYLPILYFLVMTSGHLQALVYSYIFSGLYFIYKLLLNKDSSVKKIICFSLIIVLSFLLMAIQLLPTLEMGKHSVRFDENYISEYNFGLLSLDRIVTLFAPDYFGNPATFNFWGSFNYHETIIYCGILPIFALIFAIFNFKRLKQEKFFLMLGIISLFFAFNTYLGKSIYFFKIPGISTSAAGRIIYIFVFCISVLTGFFIANFKNINFKKSIRYYWGYFVFLLIIVLETYFLYRNNLQLTTFSNNFKIALRNLVLPIIISISIFFVLAFIKNQFIKKVFLLLILILDLFRFGWKYLPFVSAEYIYPSTDITNFLKSDNSLFRIEKEKGPLMTPNVWSFYSLQSPSGYDPMALNDYSVFFQKELNQNKNGGSSRYSEIDNYNAQNLGQANVKYLLALNYDNIDKISSEGKILNYKISSKEWKEVYRYKSVSILENTKFKNRFEVLDDTKAIIDNVIYSPNKISLNVYTDKSDNYLVLRDTWYPGWQATINDQEVSIEKYQGIYRKIHLYEGNNFIKFVYHPKSFFYGLNLSIFGLFLWLFFFFKFRNN